ncbi:MAG TPA: RagB/SusD family nutrient uptake outer membrane protein [Saprospiraceae bacterium]|nr:RagB/SusD family nutrient uptake outer membrane protein [Saprospiraceae bacterium]HMQ82662.1 RagB/SusD family nutrient uptake outer membrane protein [Saprospiraceae bacterium]
MKKHITNLTLIAALFAASACTDLELTPPDKAVPDVFFQDEESYVSFIARVYSGLAVTGQSGPAGSADISSLDEGFSNYLRQYWQLQELTTDEAVIAWGDEGLPELHNHTWSSANQFVRAMYYRIFFQVSMANEFIRESTPEKLDSRGVSEEGKKEIEYFRAEARFLRALSYWHGIDLFGNIPFYTEETEVGGAAPDQADRATVFNFIESELNDIESQIKEPGTNDYGRADRAAVWMLQAKLYLNAEIYTGTARYADALNAAKKVIDSGAYSMQDTYAHLFRTDNNTSNEIIWAIPFDGQSTQTWGGMTYLVHAPVGGNMQDNVNDETGEDFPDEVSTLYGINGGWAGLRTTSALVDKFPAGQIDERAIFYTNGQNKSIENIGTFQDGYGVLKFQNVSSTGAAGSDLTHADTDYPMFRLAEAYLIYAEAVLRGGGGDPNTALGYINALRERAYNSTAGNITADQMTLDFVLDERARELYWEGTRRQDLIRYNQFTENGIWPWKGGVKEGKTTEKFRELLPIPIAEILANPKLSQNDGY